MALPPRAHAVRTPDVDATRPDSALAVERFDTAPGGRLSYQRGSPQVSDEVATAVAGGQAVGVAHWRYYDDRVNTADEY